MHPILPILFLFLSLQILSCTKDRNAGNSIETENTVSFSVLDQNNRPLKMARISILPLWYVADTSSQTNDSVPEIILTCDKNGRAEWDNYTFGKFIAIAGNDSIASYAEIKISETLLNENLHTLKLTPTGSISGKVDLPTGTPHAWVQIYGMNRCVKTDSLGLYSVSHLPAGEFRIRAIQSKSVSSIAEEVVEVQSNQISELGSMSKASFQTEDLETWQHHRFLSVDSLISTWMLPLPSVAILTVRLDSAQFPFSSSLEDGRDLRFSDSQFEPIPFQIVYWDHKASKAVVELQLDFSQISLQDKVQMSWGRSGASFATYPDIWNAVDDSLFLAWNSILLDDFEDSSAQSSLPAPIPPTIWYMHLNDSTMTSSPTLQEGISKAFQPAGDGRNGLALHYSYTAAESDWLQLGAGLGNGPRDFTTMDSLVYWVRGNGIYTLALDQLIGNTGKTVFRDTLKTSWTRIRLRPTDFDPADGMGGNLGWASVCDSITDLTIFTYNGTEFWIDDIRFYGINRDDLK